MLVGARARLRRPRAATMREGPGRAPGLPLRGLAPRHEGYRQGALIAIASAQSTSAGFRARPELIADPPGRPLDAWPGRDAQAGGACSGPSFFTLPATSSPPHVPSPAECALVDAERGVPHSRALLRGDDRVLARGVAHLRPTVGAPVRRVERERAMRQMAGHTGIVCLRGDGPPRNVRSSQPIVRRNRSFVAMFARRNRSLVATDRSADPVARRTRAARAFPHVDRQMCRGSLVIGDTVAIA